MRRGADAANWASRERQRPYRAEVERRVEHSIELGRRETGLPWKVKKILAEGGSLPHIARSRNSADMKAKIIITPKKAVVDPQGKTVQGALEHMGYKGVGAVHVGKYLEIELAGGDRE